MSKSASEVEIKPFGENGLIFSSQAQKRPFHVTFDGKAYNDVDQDPEAQKGFSFSQPRERMDGCLEFDRTLADDQKTMTCRTIDKNGEKSVIVSEQLCR